MKKGLRLGVLLLLLLLPAQAVKAGNVSNENALRTDLGNNPVVTADITITQPLVITSGSTVIDLQGHTLTLGSTIEEMFQVQGNNTSVIIRNGTLDGAEKGRLLQILGAKVSLEQVTVKNGTTDNFQKKLDASGVNRQSYQGGAVYLEQAGTLTLVDTVFRDNYAKKATPAVEHDGDPAIAAHGGAIYSGGRSTISIKGGAFYDNFSGTTVTKRGNGGEGGAIKLEGGSQLYINEKGSADRTIFDGNHNYMAATQAGGYQGGAIEATDSIIKAYNTDFVVKGGFDTGGAIKFEQSGQKLNHNIIEDSTFKLVGGQLPTKPEASTYFGTSGGAIMSEESYLTVKNTTFTTEATNGAYPRVEFAGGFIDVVGGGEFNLYDSNLTGNGAIWNEAWRYKTAKYGGAIAFENGASAKAHIKGTTLTNFMVDHTGGVISVGHRKGAAKDYGNTTVELLIEDSTLRNAHAYTFNEEAAGAGVYISSGSNVVVSGGTIEYMTSNFGAAVYNKGNLTFENKAQVKNNTTTQMGAGVMNDGYLNVHSANFANNVKNRFFNNGNHRFKSEHGGDSIYAKKDVIIGTDASFDGNDVRVFDQTSAVILSGPRNSVVNVSISEAPNTASDRVYLEDFAETASRYVGYLVGRGLTDPDLKAAHKPAGTVAGYVPTPEDAKKLHYVSRTVEANKIASVNDHTTPALWDYVYDPDASTIVLGQRAKMVYHSNHASATIDGGVADTDPAGQKLEQLYTFYKSGNGAPKVSIDNVAATELTETDAIPSLTVGGETYEFRGWYKKAWKEKPIYNETQSTPSDSEKYDFTNATFTNAWHRNTNDQITDILSVDEKNTLHTYAVYQRGRITVRVQKIWNASDKEDVTFVLKGGEQEIEKTLSKDSTVNYVEFTDLKMVDGSGNPLFDKYTVEEKGATDGKITLGGRTYAVTVTYANDTMAEAEKEPQTKYYTVTNTQLRDVQVKKEWQGSATQPAGKVEVELYKSVGGGQPTLVKTEELTAAGSWTKIFTGLPMTEEVGGQSKPVVYSVKEKGVTDQGTIQLEGKKYRVTVSGSQEDGFTISNRQYIDMAELIPGTTQLKVSKTWVGDRAEAEVQVQLYKNGAPEGNTVALNEGNGWTHTFDQLPVVDTILQPQKNVYEIKEVGENGGTVTLNGHDYSVKITQPSAKEAVITNTYMPKKQIKVTKEWAGEKTVPASAVYVQLYRTVEGTESQVENGMKELSEANSWTYTFENLPSVQKEGDTLKPITYSVKEIGEQDGKIQLENKKYRVSITGDEANGFVVANKQYMDMADLIPGKTKLKVSKTWTGHKAVSEVQVQLYKNGAPEGNAVTLNEGNGWTHTFDQLPVVDTILQPQKNVYEVKEVGETDGIVTLGGEDYAVKITRSSATEAVIRNTHMPKKQIKVTKEWAGEKTVPASAVSVQLYQTVGGTESPVENGMTELSEANGWSHVFANLPGVQKEGDTLKPITYSVKEVGEQDGKIQLENKKYRVSITGDEANGFVITNKQYMDMADLIPGKTKLKVSKTWKGYMAVSEVQVQLYKNGAPEGNAVTLNEGNGWTHTFDQLPVVDTILQPQKNVYEVKEVGETDGIVTLDGEDYAVKITHPSATEVVIRNTHMPKTDMKVTKKWAGEKTIPASAVSVQLYQTVDGTESPVENGIKELSEANGWTYTFENLPGVQKEGDTLKPITYSVKEVGEKDGMLVIGDRKYSVGYEAGKTETIITNTEIKKELPKPENNGSVASKKKAPKTGDAGSWTGYALAFLLSAGGILQTTKKRTQKR